MRKNFGAKPYLYPMPVLIIAAYDEKGNPQAMNAAWGGFSDTTEVTICVSSHHKTMKSIVHSKAFTVSMGTQSQMIQCDYVGIVSGNKVDNKIEKAGWHVTKSDFVDAPLIDELPMALECELIKYEADKDLLVGRVVNVNADESILDAQEKIDPQKLQPIIYDPVNHRYLSIGTEVGTAFEEGKKLK